MEDRGEIQFSQDSTADETYDIDSKTPSEKTYDMNDKTTSTDKKRENIIKEKALFNFFEKYPETHQSVSELRKASVDKLMDMNEALMAQVMELQERVNETAGKSILGAVIGGYGNIRQITNQILPIPFEVITFPNIPRE